MQKGAKELIRLQRLLSDFHFVKKMTRDDKYEKCRPEFPVASGTLSGINVHLKSGRHKNSLLFAGFSKATHFFKTSNPVEKELYIAPIKRNPLIVIR